MARTVRDAALLLGALAAVDPDDEATAAGKDRSVADYTHFLDAKGLRGARLGVARNYFGFHDAVDAVLEETLAALRRQGATLVDPAELPNMDMMGTKEPLAC
jgi:amidase